MLLMTSMAPLLSSPALIRTRLLETHLETLLVVLPGSATLMLLLVVHKATCSPSSLAVPLADVLVPLVSPKVPGVLMSRLVSMSLSWMLARAPSVL